MPEFDFKLSNSEMDDVVDFIFSKGAYLVMDDFYPTPEAPEIRTKEAYNAYERDHISLKFYIMREDFMECPLFYSSIIKNEKRVYYIMDRYGGPNIIMGWWKMVNAGLCTYYATYFKEQVIYEYHRPSEALVQLYKEIFKYIRKKGTIVKYKGHRKYCGKEYLEQVRNGTIVKVDPEFKELIMNLTEK